MIDILAGQGYNKNQRSAAGRRIRTLSLRRLQIKYIKGGKRMISFLICLLLLLGGYFVYGKVVENTFEVDDRETPAVRINDGVDYVVMPQWKLFLVQLLNIAGLGPIFGAMQGALWGPVVFLWITFGTIFAGGVHDYFSGMLSERHDGASISEVCGIYLGGLMKNVMRVFSIVLLVMVGTVFAVGPAGLIVTLFKNGGVTGVLTSTELWLWIILAYYFVATFLSIDKIIGKIYPLFGICLIIMAIGVAIGTFTNAEYVTPEIWTHFTNMHPDHTPDLERDVHYCCLRSYLRFPFHPVSADGKMHEIRTPGAFRILWSHDGRRRDRADLGGCRMFPVRSGRRFKYPA